MSQIAQTARVARLPGGRDRPASALVEVMNIRWMDYALMPYERELGIRELEGLGARVLAHDDGGVAAIGDPTRIIDRATYFSRVSSPAGSRVTDQYSVELRHLAVSPGGRRRQATRYGLHGVHEYKGKFNPQVTRSLVNAVDPDAGLLVDPFCGSGTALIEGMRLGLDVAGVDRSPMAALLSNAKMEATASGSRAQIAIELRDLAERCATAIDQGQQTVQGADLGPLLPADAIAYLQRWFTEPAFAALSQALALLGRSPQGTALRLARLALSSVLRDVSLQLPEDLRIRRRPVPFSVPAIAPIFLASVERIERGLAETCEWPTLRSSWRVENGDSTDFQLYDSLERERKKALILTSPPYASALPYIDTDRLSLVALGLVSSSELSALDRRLLGSREWTRSEWRAWEERRVANADRLPASVVDLLARIEQLNSGEQVGFRKEAVPALLYRYFALMGRAFNAWRNFLDSSESAVLIVGRNQTRAGGDSIEIPTSELLGDVATHRGFVVREILSLETWPRYGLHAANGVSREDAVILSRRD